MNGTSLSKTHLWRLIIKEHENTILKSRQNKHINRLLPLSMRIIDTTNEQPI